MKGVINAIGSESITKNGYKVVNVSMENGDTGRALIGLEKDKIWFKEGDEVEYQISENQWGKNIKITKERNDNGGKNFQYQVKDNSVWFAINNACLLASHGVISQDNHSIEESAKFLLELSKRIK